LEYLRGAEPEAELRFYFPATRENNRQFFLTGAEIVKFCPKIADSVFKAGN
jgi:hypothetical protein